MPAWFILSFDAATGQELDRLVRGYVAAGCQQAPEPQPGGNGNLMSWAELCPFKVFIFQPDRPGALLQDTAAFSMAWRSIILKQLWLVVHTDPVRQPSPLSATSNQH
jgi:hypothetical protein